jgi:plastocyanin
VTGARAAVGAGLLLLALFACDSDQPGASTPPPGSVPAVAPAPAPLSPPTPPTPFDLACRADPRSGPAPLTVKFLSFPSGGSGTYDFDWQFGDGTSSTQAHPTHTYTASGVFEASVGVTSGPLVRGCQRTITVTEGTGSGPAAPDPGRSPGALADLVITIVANNGGMSFSPSLADARVGQRVVWRNGDNALHTATADGGAFDTGPLSPLASSGALVMTAPGNFPYHCEFHPGMVAALRVAP